MRIAFFDTHKFDRDAFDTINTQRPVPHKITYLEPRLTLETAGLAQGYPVVCAFANDRLSSEALAILAAGGTRLIALRSAGFNHCDLRACATLGLKVVRVPEYSPYSVAEHSVALMLTLNRKIHRAHARVREMNFSLDGLTGFDMHGKTAGVVGTGRIGAACARILLGFGCRVLAYDLKPDQALVSQGVNYMGLDSLLERSDIVTLHIPLKPETRHLIDVRALGLMRAGAMIINTGRGALIDTAALITCLKNGHIGAAGLDVYEEEEGLFFNDLSGVILQDDVLARLLTFPNVVVTSHQAFLTHEALRGIAQTTLDNVSAFEAGLTLINEVKI